MGLRTVTVISGDTQANTNQQVCKPDQVKLVGGGGTDMRVLIAAAEALKPRPHAIILCTDGETPYPAAPTRAPLIVARTQHSASYAEVPRWAKLVDIVPEGK